jgi:hypothetical protein
MVVRIYALLVKSSPSQRNLILSTISTFVTSFSAETNHIQRGSLAATPEPALDSPADLASVPSASASLTQAIASRTRGLQPLSQVIETLSTATPTQLSFSPAISLPASAARTAAPTAARASGVSRRSSNKRSLDETLPPTQRGPSSSVLSTPRKKAKTSSSALTPLVLDLTPAIAHQHLEQVRDTFRSELSLAVATVKKNNRIVQDSFTAQEAADITNFFFDEVMGKPALSRLTALVKFYNTAKLSNITHMSVVARAERLAQERNNSLALTSFYQSFSRVLRNQVAAKSSYDYFLRTIDELALYYAYEQLINPQAREDQILGAHLSQLELTTSHGRGWSSVIRKYLQTQLQVSPAYLSDTCQLGHGSANLVARFGSGVLTLLPPKSSLRYTYSF